MLAFLMVMGKNVAWAEEGETTSDGETTSTISIPNTLGEYIATTNATTTGIINNNDKGGLGSIKNGATATFTLTASEQLEDVYLTFMTATNTENDNKVIVDVTADGYSKSQTFAIPKAGNNWDYTTGTKHALDLGTLPKGTITLKFSFSNTSDWICNLGNIAFYQGKQFTQEPSEYIALDKGTYSNSKCPEANANVKGGYQIGNLKITLGMHTTFLSQKQENTIFALDVAGLKMLLR